MFNSQKLPSFFVRASASDPAIILIFYQPPLGALCDAKVMEGNETPSGWPLGLENMNSRIRVADTSHRAAPPQPIAPQILRSSSFSSFSSSNLDTESTASFFPDQSVSLGRLIGIRPPARKGSFLYSCEQRRKMGDERYQYDDRGVSKLKAMKILRDFVLPCSRSS